MVENPLSDERRLAGLDYGRALEALGFKPEALLWTIHAHTKEKQLAIVTTLVDRIGSLDIYEVLFEAYDRAGTPRSINPFIVSLYSPQSVFAGDLERAYGMSAPGNAIGHLVGGGTIDLGEPWFKAGDYLFRRSWVYIPPRRQPLRESQMRQWREFKKNVERLAA